MLLLFLTLLFFLFLTTVIVCIIVRLSSTLKTFHEIRDATRKQY